MLEETAQENKIDYDWRKTHVGCLDTVHRSITFKLTLKLFMHMEDESRDMSIKSNYL